MRDAPTGDGDCGGDGRWNVGGGEMVVALFV